MDKIPADVLEEIKKQVLKESLDIKVNVKDVSAQDITFTIQLLINLPYIEICSIDFKVVFPGGGEIKSGVRRKPSTKTLTSNNKKSSELEPFDLKVPYKVLFDVLKEAASKGLQVEYELVLFVAMKKKSYFSSTKSTRITSKGKINVENSISDIFKSCSIDTGALTNVILRKALPFLVPV